MMKNSNALLPDQPINHHESSKSEFVDPALVMESERSHGGTSSESDFGFAFNDINFSDRLLRIEVINENPGVTTTNSDGVTTTWARHSKRRRENGTPLSFSSEEIEPNFCVFLFNPTHSWVFCMFQLVTDYKCVSFLGG